MNKLLLTPEPFLTGRPLEVWLASTFGILQSVAQRSWSINADGLVDVEGDVRLHNLGTLTRLPVRFGSVSGNFHCGANRLVSLEGAPNKVGGDFNCSCNKLVSLEGGPKEVGGIFLCDTNKLVSLKGAPNKVVGILIAVATS